MALQVADRVQVTSSTYTTSSFTLGSAVTGFQGFSALTNGNTTYYAATDSSGNWEVGYGAYTSATPALARTTILASSNSGSVVSFSGTVNIFITYPAEKVVIQDSGGNVSINTYVSNTTTTIGTLNVGTGGYSVSTTGQIATFYGTDTTWANVVLQNNNGGNTSYSSFVTTANNYSSVYMEMGTNSSTYSYSAAGYGNNAANAANANFVESVGADLVLTTFGSNAIHFVVNSGNTGTTTDAMTISTSGGTTVNYQLTSTVSTGTAPFVVASTTQVANLNAATAGSVTNALTLNNGGSGAASGTTYNGSSAVTLSYNTLGASPVAGSSSIVTVGTVTTGTWNANVIGVGYGGTGLSSTPSNGQIDIGNGTNFTRTTITQGSGITVTNGSGSITVANAGVTSNVAGTGISVSGSTGAVTITNTGVTSAVAGTGISVSGSTGAVTITNSGVTSLTGTTSQVTVSASTGGVTLSLPSTINVNTSGNAATTSQTNFSNLTIGGSQVLYAGNYTSYSPSLTGSGASGTWGINITGNAATATNGLTTGNYNSYAPTLTGGGASGTWSINVTGSAGSASSATTATTASTANALNTGNNYQMNSLGVGTGASGTGGEIRATNNVTAYYSDDRLKTRLGPIKNALDKVKKLTGFYYEANELAQSMGYKVKREVGLSAQDMQNVMPEIVTKAPISDEYLTIWYERIAPLLVEAIKEIDERLEKLETK